MRLILAALTLCVLSGCGGGEVPAETNTNHTRDIIAAALAAMDYRGVPPAPFNPEELRKAQLPREVLVSSTSLCFGAATASKESNCTFTQDDSIESPALDSVVPRELRKELLRKNRTRQPLDIATLPRVRVVDAGDTRKLVNDRTWTAFYDRYPQTAGWLETSQPVLSADESHALVYFEHRCHGLCGTGTLIYLERTPAGWIVLKKLELWIS